MTESELIDDWYLQELRQLLTVMHVDSLFNGPPQSPDALTRFRKGLAILRTVRDTAKAEFKDSP